MLNSNPVKVNLNIYPNLTFNQISDTVLIFGNTFVPCCPQRLYLRDAGVCSAYLFMMKDCMKYKTKQKALDSEKGEYTFRHAMGKVGIATLFWVLGEIR